MAEVTLAEVKKVYPGGVEALRRSTLEVLDREFMVIVGPSGCGKSTLLRMIAGLEEPTEGAIRIGRRTVNDVPPKDRDIAMVFQNYALYPHMTVYSNMAFGLKLRKYPGNEIDRRVKEAARSLGIDNLLDRKPKALSGGQCQRVALGRAIVRQPAVFLLDEPLSNLDAKMRVAMRKELKLLHQRLQTTMIYVTHDQVEAMTLGQRICVMNQGAILQVGAPIEIYNRPINRFVAGFIGTPPINFFEGELAEEEGTLFFVTHGMKIMLNDRLKKSLRSHGPVTGVTLGIRPESLGIVDARAAEDHAGSCFSARVEVMEELGDERLIYCRVNETPLVLKSSLHEEIDLGQCIRLRPDSDRLLVFAGKEGENVSIRSS